MAPMSMMIRGGVLSPWLRQINDSEDESFEKLDVTQRLEAEIKILTESISPGTLQSQPTSSSLSPYLAASDVFDFIAFKDEPMDIDLSCGADLTKPSLSSSEPPPLLTSSDGSPKTKLLLKEYMARKKQRLADGEQPIAMSTLPCVAPAPAPVLLSSVDTATQNNGKRESTFFLLNE